MFICLFIFVNKSKRDCDLRVAFVRIDSDPNHDSPTNSCAENIIIINTYIVYPGE